jgi:hypothetical protein
MPDPVPAPPGGLPLPGRIIVSFKAGAVLAVANIVCMAIFAWAWNHVRAEPKTISVTGSAKKVIQSDLIVWSAHLSSDAPTLQEAYRDLKTSLDKTVAYLTAHGIAASQIEVGSIQTGKHHERDSKGNETDKVTSYQLSESVEVTGTDIGKVSDAARTVTDLIEDGVMLESDPPQFIYTKLADLKITMLAEATADATNRAKQIAVNSGSNLSTIVDAKMGVMQINALHSSDATGSGVNDTTSREKEITAVVTARFGLK